jgi:serine/threonine protein kinase
MLPELIDRYQIQSEIGRGGMAIIYLAYDPQHDRYVAIKVLPPEYLNTPQFRARFQREIEIMISIKHPRIVPIYGYGQFQGQLYLVMRYMAGGSLEEYIERDGKLSIEETAALIEQIAPLLDEAHSKGIVHRDLKPSNILFDDQGQPFISDFGIARLTEQSNLVALTGKQLIGSPAYMSPEQARIGTQVDGRSDIYSLGVMVFEMLTGELPYHAENPMKLVLKQIMDPVPDILSINPDLPPECDAIIRKAMAKDPEERYSNALELAYDLKDMAGGGIQPSYPPAARPYPEKHPPAVKEAPRQIPAPVEKSQTPGPRRSGVSLPPFLNSFTHSIRRFFRVPGSLRGPSVPYITIPSFLRPILGIFGISNTVSLPKNKIWLIFGLIVLLSVIVILCVGVFMACYVLLRFATAHFPAPGYLGFFLGWPRREIDYYYVDRLR